MVIIVKKVIALILILCMCISVVSVSANDAETNDKQIIFSDVSESDSSYTAVMYLAEKGIISGKGNSLFCPNDTLKREELAKIITNAFGLDLSENAPVFKDVPAGVWYADCVRTVAQHELMKGISTDEFGSGYDISRQDLAVILKRFLERKGVELRLNNSILFADASEIADYAKEAVEVLAAVGIMKDKEKNCFAPDESATRAETVEAIYNALLLQKKQVDELGLYGDHTQYMGPFDVPNDRLQEAMPEPFDIMNIEGVELAFEDFEDSDYGMFSPRHLGSGAAFASEGGYGDNGGCLVLEGTSDTILHAQLHWTAEPGEIMPGDYYIFTAMVKAEGISGSGMYRPILSVYDDKGEWVTESGNPTGKKDADWTKYEYVVMVPEGRANTYDTIDFYSIAMAGYINKLDGKVFFDNFSLKKARFDPMNTVLMTPNYKGIITEENGIGDIALRAYVDHINLWDLSEFDFKAQITDENHNVLMKSETGTVTSVMDVYFSSKDLEVDNDYYLESILTDKETGEIIQKSEWPLHKKTPDFVPAIGYDKYGRVTKNGEPFIPKSIYNWDDPADVEGLLDAEPINVIQTGDYGSTINFGTSDLAQENAKKMEKRGMSMNAQLRPFTQNKETEWYTNYIKTQSDVRGAIGKLASNFKNLPNLFGYYAWDEQNPVQYGEEFSWVRKIVEQYDLGHPTLCAIDKTHTNRKGAYAKTSDFLGYDPYPVTGNHTSLSRVYEYVMTGKATNPNRPVYAILQAYWDKNRGDLRGPNETEFRNMAFQAICAGSCMLDAFAYSDMLNRGDPYLSAEEMLAYVVDVYAEIEYLEPIILSMKPAPYYEVSGGGDWFKHMSKRHNGKSYLFAVNVNKEENFVRVHLDGVKEIKSMYTDTVYEADQSGWFKIEMESFGTDVFEYEQADYKSSHAELTRFGFSEIILENSESERPCFIVKEGTNTVEYSAVVSDYATVYINGIQSQQRGIFDISGLKEIVVKVVSEDERFMTEKTFDIKWIK